MTLKDKATASLYITIFGCVAAAGAPGLGAKLFGAGIGLAGLGLRRAWRRCPRCGAFLSSDAQENCEKCGARIPWNEDPGRRLK